MKTFAAIFLLVAVFFFKSNSSAADVARVSPSPLEVVLIEDQVQLYSWSITNSIEIIFRNVGESLMNPNDLPLGLSIVWDGKEYKLAHPEQFYGYNQPSVHSVHMFTPKHFWRCSFLLSDFVIPPEVLTSGRHTIAVRDEFSATNTITIPPDGKSFSKPENRQIFAESGTLTVFIQTPYGSN